MTEGSQEELPTAAAASPTPADAPAAPVALSAAPAPGARPGRVRRFFNWFWRGRELKQLRLEQRSTPPQVGQLNARARLLFELAERTRRPAEPLPSPAEAAAAELFRQSAYFAVRAVAAARAPSDSVADPWRLVDAPLREKLHADPERVQALSSAIEAGTFVEPWELSDEQRARRCSELAHAARALLDELAWHTRARDALWLQRLVRVALLLAVILGVVATARFLAARSEQGRDLATGKAWKASSLMGGVGCTSPLQDCGESTDYFFHTNDENAPWVEIDLGAPATFTGVRVENRKDCCFDRAVPLIIEVADNQKRYREVARRTTSFSSWLATFAPTNARYVRLRVPRQSILHLARVRVLR